MAIRLDDPQQGMTAAEWERRQWAERLKTYEKEFKALRDKLAEIIAATRKDYEKFLYQMWRKKLERFTKNRKPSETSRQYHERIASDEIKAILKKRDESKYSYFDTRQLSREERDDSLARREPTPKSPLHQESLAQLTRLDELSHLLQGLLVQDEVFQGQPSRARAFVDLRQVRVQRVAGAP